MTPMLSCVTVPESLSEVVEALRGAFTAPGFATFKDLLGGMLAATGEHSVTGMWIAAGLAGRAHWGRAHRFFSHARWDADCLGLLLAPLAVALFAPSGALCLVVDDTLFHRYGKKVHGAFYQHDGSATGRDGLGRGNCFVILGLAVNVPFMTRTVLLPLLFRLNLGKQGPSKVEQARTMVGLIARAFPDRRIDVVADALYRGKAWRDLPPRITFTTRLASNAALSQRPAPQPPGTRGHPRWKGEKLGSLAQIAAGACGETVSVTAYAKTTAMQIAVIDCLWWGSLHRTPVRLVLAREPTSKKLYDIALITTDLAVSGTDLVAGYSWRWSIEQTIRDCKLLLGVGDARNRLQAAVERTVPFQMLCLTILYCWYATAHRETAALTDYREQHPWDRRKAHVSVDDMLVAFRRQRIKDKSADHATSRQTPDGAVTCGLAVA
jgi:hypothetical protein